MPLPRTAQVNWVLESEVHNVDRTAEVSCIAVLDHIPCFVCGDTNGSLHLWSFRSPRRPVVLSSWQNERTHNLKYSPTVTFMVYLSEYHLLYTADDFGQLCTWDLSLILAKWLHRIVPVQTFPAQLVQLVVCARARASPRAPRGTLSRCRPRCLWRGVASALTGISPWPWGAQTASASVPAKLLLRRRSILYPGGGGG